LRAAVVAACAVALDDDGFPEACTVCPSFSSDEG